jgi:hypothetical protein
MKSIAAVCVMVCWRRRSQPWMAGAFEAEAIPSFAGWDFFNIIMGHCTDQSTQAKMTARRAKMTVSRVLWRCSTWAEPARLAASTLSQK